MARGSGRTTAQLAALPDGALFLVPNGRIASYCRNLLISAGRRHNALTFVTPGQHRALVGLPRRTVWDVDHAYEEVAGRSGEEALLLLRIASPDKGRS